jgi:hypothetical protein
MAAKLVVCVLVILALVAPAGLSAKDRRGATVIVTRLDGEAVKGELIAVKPEGLFLLSAEGNARTVDRADVKSVRIVRRSRAGLFAGIGGAAGLAGMGALVLSAGEDVEYGTEKVLIGAGAGALAGFLAGMIRGVDSEFTVAGQPEAVVADSWRKLGAYSREGRLPGPAPRTKAGARPPQAPRFKIGLSASVPVASHGYLTSVGEGSYEFIDVYAAPPDDYRVPLSFSQQQVKQLRDVYFGPVSLAYELTEKMSAEAELVLSGKALQAGSTYGEMAFTPSPSGPRYHAYAGANYHTGFASLLLGLSFRTKLPAALDRHIFEVGAAAGPALGTMTLLTWDEGSQRTHKIALSGKIHAAYDFHILPSFSLGAFVGYRYIRVNFPSSTYSAEIEFREVGNESNALTRPVEVTLPGQAVKWPGPYFGFRLAFRI